MRKEGDSMKNVLQWQEGTNEPEDEPNISNGEDVLPKEPPTKQPWEKSHSAGPVRRWLEMDNI